MFKGPYLRKDKMKIKKKKSDYFLIIPYQLTKVQDPGSNSFRDILLTSLKCLKFQRAMALEKHNDLLDFF